MTIQDIVAILCVAGAAVFLFSRTIARPFSRRAGKSCGSGCGKCSAGRGESSANDPDGNLLTIGPPVLSASKKPGRTNPK